MKNGIESPVWPCGRLVWQHHTPQSRTGITNLRNSSLNPAPTKPMYVSALLLLPRCSFHWTYTPISLLLLCSTSVPCLLRIYGVLSQRRTPVPKCGYATIFLSNLRTPTQLYKRWIITLTSFLSCPSFLQRSTEQMRKVPSIVLSITYKGVKFIDAASKVSYYTRTLPCSVDVYFLTLHVFRVIMFNQSEPSASVFFCGIYLDQASFLWL